MYVNPPQPTAPPAPTRANKGQGRALPPRKEKEEDPSSRAKSEEEEEQEVDRRARLRIGAFGAAEWIFGESNYLYQLRQGIGST